MFRGPSWDHPCPGPDPIHSLTSAGMLGTSHAVRTTGRLALRSSLPGFPTAASQREERRRQTMSCPGPMPRSGLSLTRNDCPLPDHHCEVNAPGLPLRRSRRSVSEARSAFGYSALRWFDASFGRDRRRKPVTPAPVQRLRLLRASTPLQGLATPSGSKRSARSTTGKPTLDSGPISCRSPNSSYR
jgi:hypothetical protein